MGWRVEDLTDKQKKLLSKLPTQPITTLTIPLELPSPNVYLRWHWAKRARLKKDLAAHMYSAVPHKPYPAVSLSVTRVCTRRITDIDNEAFIVKPLLDAMVNVGIITDDNSDIVKSVEVNQLTRSQAKKKTDNDSVRTIVEIEVVL